MRISTCCVLPFRRCRHTLLCTAHEVACFGSVLSQMPLFFGMRRRRAGAARHAQEGQDGGCRAGVWRRALPRTAALTGQRHSRHSAQPDNYVSLHGRLYNSWGACLHSMSGTSPGLASPPLSLFWHPPGTAEADGFLNDDGNNNPWDEPPPMPEEDPQMDSQEHITDEPIGLQQQQALQHQPPQEAGKEPATAPPPAKRARVEAADDRMGAPAALCVFWVILLFTRGF